MAWVLATTQTLAASTTKAIHRRSAPSRWSNLHPQRRQQRYVCDAKPKLQYQQREHQQGQLALRGARDAAQQQPADEEAGNHRSERVKNAQALAANCAAGGEVLRKGSAERGSGKERIAECSQGSGHSQYQGCRQAR